MSYLTLVDVLRQPSKLRRPLRLLVVFAVKLPCSVERFVCITGVVVVLLTSPIFSALLL